MEHWHGFETARNVAQIYETTIADSASDLSARFVTVPARSLGGGSYLFEGSDGPLENYMYHEATGTLLMAVFIRAGMVLCGSATGMTRALESGLRQRLIDLVKSSSGENQDS
jgi:hypothetical protein